MRCHTHPHFLHLHYALSYSPPFLACTLCSVILTPISCMYIMLCHTHPHFLHVFYALSYSPPFLACTLCAVILTPISCITLCAVTLTPNIFYLHYALYNSPPFYIFCCGLLLRNKWLQIWEKLFFKFFFLFNYEGGSTYSAKLQICLQVLCLIFKYTPKNFTFMWPCIVTNFLTVKPTRCINSSNLIWKWNSTCFGQFLSP
jgi:hypothetical protein